MRNGNRELVSYEIRCKTRSYRTYEEWKLATRTNKHRSLYFRSYRTYEEWKQIKDGYVYVIEGKVLTVPMRNGNWHYFMWG